MSKLGELGKVIVTTTATDENVLTEDVFRDVKQLDSDIRNIVVDVSQKTYNYSDLCAGSCQKDVLLLLHEDFHIDLNIWYILFIRSTLEETSQYSLAPPLAE